MRALVGALLVLLLALHVAQASPEDAAAELVQVDALIAQLSERRTALLNRVGLPDAALAPVHAQFTPGDVFATRGDTVAGDILAATALDVQFAVVASRDAVQMFDADERVVLDIAGLEDVVDVRAVSGAAPCLVVLTAQGHVSLIRLAVRRNANVVTVEQQAPAVSLAQRATCVEVAMQKSLPRILLGTQEGKIHSVNVHGDVHATMNASDTDAVTHMSLGANQLLAFATSSGAIGFASAVAVRPFGGTCAVHAAQQGSVVALAMDATREAKYVYVSTSTGELAVYDRFAKEPVRSSPVGGGGGIRNLLSPGGSFKTACALVHRVMRANATHLAALGSAVFTSPVASLRSPHARWERGGPPPQPAWHFARSAMDAKSSKALLLVLRAGQGMIISPLPDASAGAAAAAKRDAVEWSGGLFSDRGPIMFVVGLVVLVSVVGRGMSGGLLGGRTRSPPAARQSAMGRGGGILLSETSEMLRGGPVRPIGMDDDD